MGIDGSYGILPHHAPLLRQLLAELKGGGWKVVLPAEIAAILRLKTGTIGKYLERIFPKLGVENRTAAASFVLGTNKTT